MMKTTQRFLLLCTVLTLCCFVAGAQDAGQVLRLSVQYNTLKNSSKMSDEVRAEVGRLEKLAQEANAARRYGEAIKHLSHASAILRGQSWTTARAFAAALTVKLNRAVLEPEEKAELQLRQIFSLDEPSDLALKAKIELFPIQGTESPLTMSTVVNISDGMVLQPIPIAVRIPDVPPGKYRLSLTIQFPDAAEPVNKTALVHIERGLAAKFKAAKEDALKMETRLRAEKKAALLAALPSAGYRIRLFEMASASEINFTRIDFTQELKEAVALLEKLKAGIDPFRAQRGDFRKAYLSKVDNNLQPYRIFVPASYDGSKAYPLIIALHGMGGDENSYFDQYAQGGFKTEAETRGYIVACPKGREPASMYTGAAELDVMDVLEEVRRAYRIDSERIYMTGHSMGGYGTWSVAMNHPEIFAALAPVAGGGNPLTMAKIAHIPQLVVHGDNDKTVPVERSRVMVEAAKKLGVELKYIEIPGGDHVTVAARTFKDVYDFFDTHRRKGADAKAAGAAKGN
jgi:predicted esterase